MNIHFKLSPYWNLFAFLSLPCSFSPHYSLCNQTKHEYDHFVDDLLPIKQQRNTKLKTRQRKRKRRRFTISKQLKLNHHTTKKYKI